jgi:hypothetical protein
MRETMQTFLTVIGVVVLLAGLVFAGQGSGYFPYPSSSFMVNNGKWIGYGLAMALAGVLVIVFARR